MGLFLDGIINILKPPGMTSSDVVVVLRRLLQQRRIGHGGTLDPNAAGVLPVCVGRATRFVDYLDHQKTYRALLRLGLVTDTQDGDGRVVETRPVSVSLAQVRAAAQAFLGPQLQVPPMVSAVKVNGERLYRAAQRGETVERPPRPITIHRLEVESVGEPDAYWLTVVCSRGTYVRTLCHDLGAALGCGGHMAFLLRTAVGALSVQDSVPLFAVGVNTPLEPVERGVLHYPAVQVPPQAWPAFGNGVPAVLRGEPGVVRVYRAERFLGLGNVDGKGYLRMKVWLDPPGASQ